jgi:hypothetical protein
VKVTFPLISSHRISENLVDAPEQVESPIKPHLDCDSFSFLTSSDSAREKRICISVINCFNHHRRRRRRRRRRRLFKD